tara:strand:+ start:1419 stop:2180 length:762 start_codon:yes stop_codon:yes gene_type:complete
MKYNIILISIFISLVSCTGISNKKLSSNLPILEKFKNSGFTLIYEDKYFKNKTINKKINERDLIIFQKNLKKGTPVKITNPLNGKTLIAKVGKNSSYPSFNNSVVSIRIAQELEIENKEPYIIIEEIKDNALFIAKKSKTFDEEKTVADKAPVDSISVNDLNVNTNKKIKTKKLKRKFNYIIKIADFYYEDTAIQMSERIKNELNINDTNVKKINENRFRVFIGPYSSLKKLQKAYNRVEDLSFENIEFIRYE